MSLTTSDVTRMVAGFADNDESWDIFHDELLNKEAVSLGSGLFAYLEEDLKPKPDSYGYVANGVASFVFKVSGAGETQFFRKSGYLDSYADSTFSGVLEEVGRRVVTQSAWEAV